MAPNHHFKRFVPGLTCGLDTVLGQERDRLLQELRAPAHDHHLHRVDVDVCTYP